MKIEEFFFVNLDLFIQNTFSIDENFNGGWGSGHKSQLIKENPNHNSWKLIFAIFENFTNHGESI